MTLVPGSPVTPGVLIVGGPTASGKSALAVALAERFDAEIVGADSRQIYRGMPIGTAAPGAAQMARVRHHLVGFLDPRQRYSAAAYARDALAAIEGIVARGRRAIVVGGTGFYIRALCGDVALALGHDPALRARLAREARLHPPEVLHAWLAARDPQRAAALDARDRYRVVRALEIALSAAGASAARAQPSLREVGMPFLKTALEVEDAVLHARIESRVDAMLREGFVEEAERIGAAAVAANAVGYPLALAYLAGAATPDELRALLIRATARYAKRQRTWFRSEQAVRFTPPQRAFESIVEWARELPGWT